MKFSQKIYTVLMLVLMYAPIAIMIFFSFNEGRSTARFDGFSFKWYEEVFRNRNVQEALSNTLILAVLSAVVATLIGTMAAVGIHRMKRRYLKSAITATTNIPMMNPDIVTAVSMLMLFVFCGNLLGIAPRSFYTVLIAHITFNLPYVVLSVLPKLRQMDKNLTEAALDLGCTPRQAFFRVELPFIMPGILSGMLMAFTLSIDDFIITQFTKGEGFNTLPTYIYSMTKRRVTPDMYALSALIFGAIFVLLLISNIVRARSEAKLSPHRTKKTAAGVVTK